MLWRRTRDEAADVFVVDPEVPVIAPGGIASASGCINQAAMEQGNNLLVYTALLLAKRCMSSDRRA